MAHIPDKVSEPYHSTPVTKAKRKACAMLGICTACGKSKVMPGFKRCAKCRKDQRARSRACRAGENKNTQIGGKVRTFEQFERSR